MLTYMTCAESDSEAEGGECPHFATTVDSCDQCLGTWLRLENTCPACRGELFSRAVEVTNSINVLREFSANTDISGLRGPEAQSLADNL
jgi:hypothetical protein